MLIKKILITNCLRYNSLNDYTNWRDSSMAVARHAASLKSVSSALHFISAPINSTGTGSTGKLRVASKFILLLCIMLSSSMKRISPQSLVLYKNSPIINFFRTKVSNRILNKRKEESLPGNCKEQ